MLVSLEERAVKVFMSISILLCLFATSYAQEQIIIFYGDESDYTQKNFNAITYVELEKFAKENNFEIIQRYAKDGLPNEITTTPQIVFQNKFGRSLYVGRYSEVERIKNFIRTSRVFPQKPHDKTLQKVMVKKDGRSSVLTPITIHSIAGIIPGTNFETFKKDALTAIDKGMEHFQFYPSYESHTTDRQFSVEIFPYVSAQRELILSIEIYSQFSCVKPIFKRMEDAVKGPFAESDQLFKSIGSMIEQEVEKQIVTNTVGDDFNTVTTMEAVSWESIGLSVPSIETSNAPTLNIPNKWEYEGPVDQVKPSVQFNFPTPLDNYAGVVQSISGSLIHSDDLSFQNIDMQFEADMSSLTMFNDDFDAEVKRREIRVKKFPYATAQLVQVMHETTPLQIGVLKQIHAEGFLTLMEIEVPIDVKMQLEVIVNENGELRLIAEGTFELTLNDNFGILGPEGPFPQNDTLIFTFNIKLKPKRS